jgi:hypothetical protein
MRLLRSLFVAVAFVPLLSGCPDAESPSGVSDEVQLRVTLDLSKGEENPSFLLSRSESRTFRSKLSDLEEQKNRIAPQPGKEGYQGLVLREVGRGDGRAEHRIKNGWVVVKNGSSVKAYADPKRTLETWVWKRGERVVPAGPYEEVRRDLESR